VETGLSHSSGEWRLLPSDIAIRPVGTGDDDIRRIRDLLGDPLPVIEVTELSLREENEVGANDSGWTFMAQVLGPPRVVDRRFETVEFERGKAEELVIWLAFHPQQRKRSLARTALWLSPVRDATFSNITAAARRSLNAVTLPPSDQTWVGITLSDDLPLAEGVVTDVDLLRDAVDWARRRPEDDGLQRLREALQLVRGVPFAGSTYTWSDGIGMSGEAAMLVVRAASMMAEMCQEIGDMSGVYWASAKGLLALPGHEELVAIRLRAHAEHGDRVAMKAEWESYRRAVASEWGDAEPSPKMMELWRRLGAG
jgi:two-component SAPR family response regulator